MKVLEDLLWRFLGDVVAAGQGFAIDLLGDGVPFGQWVEAAFDDAVAPPQHSHGAGDTPPGVTIVAIMLEIDGVRRAVVFA